MAALVVPICTLPPTKVAITVCAMASGCSEMKSFADFSGLISAHSLKFCQSVVPISPGNSRVIS